MNHLLRPRIRPSFLVSSGVDPCDVPFRYGSGPIPRYRGTVTRWHAHLRALATAIHETSGLRKHQIFMLTPARLRCVRTGCSDAHCFAASPYWSLVMFLLSLETTKETLRRHFHLQMSPILADSIYSQTSIIHCWGNSRLIDIPSRKKGPLRPITSNRFSASLVGHYYLFQKRLVGNVWARPDSPSLHETLGQKACQLTPMALLHLLSSLQKGS